MNCDGFGDGTMHYGRGDGSGYGHGYGQHNFPGDGTGEPFGWLSTSSIFNGTGSGDGSGNGVSPLSDLPLGMRAPADNHTLLCAVIYASLTQP